MTPLEEAIEVAGGAAALAQGIKASKSAPSMWLKRGSVPAEWCPSIERFTTEKGHPVTCERLRPSVDWSFLRSTNVNASRPKSSIKRKQPCAAEA